jgi:hypothetical protein
MATNKLFEAAADILGQSKSNAEAEPMPKVDAEVVDLGGPKNTDAHPMGDSEKIDANKAAKSAEAPKTKPSAASAKMEEVEFEGEQLDESDIGDGYKIKMKHDEKGRIHSPSGEHVADVTKHESGWQYHSGGKNWDGTETSKHYKTGVEKTKMAAARKAAQIHLKESGMREDVDSMFADDETISEDFKQKAATIFEARVYDKLQQLEEETEARYASMLEESVEAIKEDLTEKVNDYLSYVVEQWISDNEIAIESGLRSELTEDFISGLRNLFAEHYIDVPAEKVDLVEELATKVEELEGKLNEEIEYGIDLRKALVESIKTEITYEVTEGLTATQVEKIKSLAESVDFSTEEEYRVKLETIRENYFPSSVKKADVSQLQEQVEDGQEPKRVVADPYVQSVMNALTKTKV